MAPKVIPGVYNGDEDPTHIDMFPNVWAFTPPGANGVSTRVNLTHADLSKLSELDLELLIALTNNIRYRLMDARQAKNDSDNEITE